AQAAMIMGRPDWLELARHAAELIWRVHRVGDELRRSSRDGQVGTAAAVLEDHAALCQAATRLAAATADAEVAARAEWRAPRTAGSTTPPSTPNGSTCGPRTRPTTPPRPG